jgi:hypothetical protein
LRDGNKGWLCCKRWIIIDWKIRARSSVRRRRRLHSRLWSPYAISHVNGPSLISPEKFHGSAVQATGGKRACGPSSFGPLVPVAEPGSITRDKCRSRFQHEPGPIGLHVDALRREGPGSLVPVRRTNQDH